VKPEGEPFTALIVGSDSRAGLTEGEQDSLGADDIDPTTGEAITGQRADTLILAHVDPDTDHVIMVQFPRDLYVPLADGGNGKINTALESGIHSLIRTVKDLTGLPINKYAQVNIAGFRDVVDAIGGVDVCIPKAIPFDSATGIEIKEPGMIHFDGDKAIRYVRSRKVFEEGDFARMQNQQAFLAAAIDKASSVETFLHPSRIQKLLSAAGEHLETSETLFGLKRLGERFRAFNAEDYEAYTVPNLGVVEDERGSIVVPDRPTMRTMFEAIADNESPAEADDVPNIDPSTIRVGVYNGSFKEGVASEAAEDLIAATQTEEGSLRIDDSDIANAERFTFKRTVIRYDEDAPEARQMATYVSAAVPGAQVEAGRTKPGIDVAVIVGKRRFRTERVTQILPLPIPVPGEPPAVCREDA
jgi:LCP family protein required for cell wall assembly